MPATSNGQEPRGGRGLASRTRPPVEARRQTGRTARHAAPSWPSCPPAYSAPRQHNRPGAVPGVLGQPRLTRPRPGTLSQAWDVTSCGAGAFHLEGCIRAVCRGLKGGRAMSEVAKLRKDHPRWHIDTVWACAGSGPDRRGLRASRAGVTVRAWTVPVLARRIAGHPQLAGQPRRPLPRPGAGVPAPAGGYPAGRCLRPPGPAGGTAGRARTGPGAPMVTWLPLPEAATLTAPAISQNQGGDPRAAARTAATADLTSSAPVPAVADLARPYHRRLPGAAATRSPRPAQADRRQRPRRTLPAPHPSPEAAGPMSPAPQASRPVTSTALAEPPYQGE